MSSELSPLWPPLESDIRSYLNLNRLRLRLTEQPPTTQQKQQDPSVGTPAMGSTSTTPFNVTCPPHWKTTSRADILRKVKTHFSAKANWDWIFNKLKITDKWAFVRVGYIHNAGYLGGLCGLVLSYFVVKPDKKERQAISSSTP